MIKHPHIHPKETPKAEPESGEGITQHFIREVSKAPGRTWAGTKRHGAAIILSTVISGAIGTLLPALQAHWEAQQQQATMRTIYQRLSQTEKDVIELRTRLSDVLNPPGSVGKTASDPYDLMMVKQSIIPLDLAKSAGLAQFPKNELTAQAK